MPSLPCLSPPFPAAPATPALPGLAEPRRTAPCPAATRLACLVLPRRSRPIPATPCLPRLSEPNPDPPSDACLAFRSTRGLGAPCHACLAQPLHVSTRPAVSGLPCLACPRVAVTCRAECGHACYAATPFVTSSIASNTGDISATLRSVSYFFENVASSDFAVASSSSRNSSSPRTSTSVR